MVEDGPNGYKEWLTFMAPVFNTNGITFVSIGYRLAPKHLFPEALDDVANGLAWVHHEIAAHGGNPSRIFIGGHSAGAHYAALLAVRDDWQENVGLPQNVICGCLPISGIYDFGPDSGLSMRPRFLGSKGNENAAIPINQIVDNPPPFLLAHGDQDFPHLIVQCERMIEALKAAGGQAERIVLENCDHLGTSLSAGQADGPWVRRAISWMRQQRVA